MSTDPEVRNSMPERFSGRNYIDFLSELSVKRNVERYIEIGVQNGHLLSKIHANVAVAVDPEFEISFNISQNKKTVILQQMTSDTFFSNPQNFDILNGPPDLVFLDGLHTFEYLLRDFMNAEHICGPRGLIFMHDCLPLNSEMTDRSISVSAERGKSSKFPGYWTGDVWKITPILQKYRPDLRLVFIDCPPTGLIGVTQLDSNSSILERNYLKIMDEFRSLRTDIEQIEKMYQGIKITSSEDILKDFDNTQYFIK